MRRKARRTELLSVDRGASEINFKKVFQSTELFRKVCV